MVLFDHEADFVLPAPARLGGDVVVKFPTDEQWVVRTRARKFLQRRLGRGKSEMVSPKPGEADRVLYEAISVNGSPQLTPFEASQILESVAMTFVTDVQIQGNDATVTMNVFTGEVKHFLRVPTAEEMFDYKQAAFRQLDLSHGQMQTTFNPDVGARLYDLCGGRSGPEFYKAAIPGAHKAEAVRVVIDYIENHIGPAIDDPNS